MALRILRNLLGRTICEKHHRTAAPLFFRGARERMEMMDREELIIKTAHHCLEKGTCAGCQLKNRDVACRRVLIRGLLEIAEGKEENPLLTRYKPEKVTRSTILDRAKEIVNGHREQEYGTPENNFALIGELWSALLGVDISPQKVALMMICMKVARIKTGTSTEDSWIDIAGYAACGGEIANVER